MASQMFEFGSHRCLYVDPDGAPLADAGGARDVVEEAMNENATVIALPVQCLDPSFFDLRSGLAGEVLQKAVNYGFKLAIVGDITSCIAASDAFRDLVVESDRGDSLFFVADMEALQKRLASVQAAT